MSGAVMTSKMCRVCGKVKPLEEFHRRSDAQDGRHSRCRDCASDYNRELYLSKLTPEQRRVAECPPPTPEERQERRRAYDARYRAEHPEVGWRSLYRQRAKHYGHEPVVEEFTRDDVIARWGNGCWHCPDGEFEELDHFPVSVRDGGSHTLDNVRPACRRSNLQGIKGAELRRELVAERDLIIRAAEAEMKSRQSWADHGYVRAA